MEKMEKMLVTAGANGYPEPVIGTAVRFDTFAELKKYAKDNNLDVCSFHYKDGWDVCECENVVTQPFDLVSFYFDKDNYITITDIDYLKEYLDEAGVDIDIDIEKVDFSKQFLLHHAAWKANEFEIMNIESVAFSFDTHNYFIAAFQRY